MSNVRFIADLHIGHKNILNFAREWRGGACVDTHDEWLVTQWNSVCTPRDVIWVLGDVCFDIERMPILDRMNGRKKLVRGNHDMFDLGVYLKYFEDVHGFTKYKGHWLSHAPIHPSELRGKPNIHGHTHQTSVGDPNYICVSVEQVAGVPRTLEELHICAI